VVRLRLSGALRRTLATTNPIESALSVTRRVTARVTCWRAGEMRRRWCVAGLLRAERQFRRVKGHRALPNLSRPWRIHPSTTGWNPGRRVRMAGGTTSPHDDGWGRGWLVTIAGVGVEVTPGDELVGQTPGFVAGPGL
jgi:hypothetical protein